MTLLGLLACAVAPPALDLDEQGVSLSGQPVSRVEVLDAEGLVIASKRLPEPVEELTVQVDWGEGGPHTVVAGPWSWPVDAPSTRPMRVGIQAPVGSDVVWVQPGQTLPVTHVEGQAVQVAVLVELRSGGQLSLLGEPIEVVPGERVVRLFPLSESTALSVQGPGGEVTVQLDLLQLPLEQAREQLRIDRVVFPAGVDGESWVGRPSGRVTLPSAWWQATLDATGLGFKPRDEWFPWAWQGVTLENQGEQPLDVVIRQRITRDGEPAPSFRPRTREGARDSVSALLRVPPGQKATAALPVFVDEDSLGEGPWQREVEVALLGSEQAIWRWSGPLYVSRGSTLASASLAVAALAGALGTLLILVRGSSWLRRPTSELMTIALFGGLSFVVRTAGALLGTGVSALLGPFGALLTGLVDDAFRWALMATLLTLLPRPGTAALATLVGWLLGGLALGAFQPTDPLFVGGAVLWLEAFLYLFGVTRDPSWRDGPPWQRWLRLSAAFGLSSLLSGATGLVLHVVLYRLFFAPWYVALVLLGPNFLYVLVACALAVPFAESLRRIQA